MTYKLEFLFDNLTESEKRELLRKLDLIKHHIYKDLNIESTVLHRCNRVWISQEILDEDKALELFKVLQSVGVTKHYDDYYQTGEDSHCTCNLCFVKDYPLSYEDSLKGCIV